MRLPDSEVHAALEFLYRSGRFGGSFGVALSTTVPDEFCSPASVTEVVAASYQRPSLSSTYTGWDAAAARAIETIVPTTWPAPLEDWGTCRAIVLYDTTVKATGTPVGAIELATSINALAGGSAPSAPARLIRFFDR